MYPYAFLRKIQQLLKDYFDGKEPMKGVNPDEAVTFGVAVQGGILVGEHAMACGGFDLNPMAFGIETTGGVMNKLILRNTIIPVKKVQTFSTTSDKQRTVSIRIFIGGMFKLHI
jgi:heat shock protein 5